MIRFVRNRSFLLATLLLAITFLIIFNNKTPVIYNNKPLVISNNKSLVIFNNKPNTTSTSAIPVKYLNRIAVPDLGKNWRQLSSNETRKFSKLGKILFEELEPPPVNDPNRTYTILIWKVGKGLEEHHLKNFGRKRVDPFAKCSVRNCRITYEDGALKTADLVIFFLHNLQLDDLPATRGPAHQIWAFLTDENPHYTFRYWQDIQLYNGVFNWSMTYRMDADIPVPYGRTVLKREQLRDDELVLKKRRDVLVAIMGSNCGSKNKRWEYVAELQKYIKVDVYGRCGTFVCPGHFRVDCPELNNYLFYLAFENANCDGYVTEKVWWNAFAKNAIPVVMGASRESYRKILPPGSYLNVDDYDDPRDLATYLLYLNKTKKYLDYFQWKARFQVLNEHGYFQSRSYHYCRACEALNYNEKSTKIYEDFGKFWSKSADCYPARFA